MSQMTTQEYLNTRVNPILEKMLIDLVKVKPDSVQEYMMNWLKESTEQNNLQSNYSDEEVGDLVFNPDKKPVPRTSVSAEVYGVHNQPAQFVPRLIQKTAQQIERIRIRILTPAELQVVIDAMEEKKFHANAVIIKQGEAGDELFIVDSGDLDCYRVIEKDDQPTFLRTYEAGDSFGELALLYNAPRAATIIAKTNSTLFSLDRATFNQFVKDASRAKRQRYQEFLKSVELLQEVDSYEIQQIADCLISKSYEKGDYIVKQGEIGDHFIMLEKGEAKAYKNYDGGIEIDYYYQLSDYFGEIALLKNQPRACSVIAMTVCNTVQLERASFKRLLGPLDTILHRNFKRYEKYMQ